MQQFRLEKRNCPSFYNAAMFLFLWGIGALLVLNQGMYGQSCGTGSNYQWDTINWGSSPPPVRIVDNNGVELSGQDLIIPTNPQGAIILPNCVAGKFTLVFDDNFMSSGVHFFDDPNNLALSQQRRDCVCKVFEDLSRFIQDPPGASAGRVNIRIRLASNPSSALGVALPFFVTPNFTSGLVLDNEVYKTILSTQSSYTQYPAFLLPQGLLFHGAIALDYSQIANNVTYHIDPTITAPGSVDLYTLILHEALHMLGFVSNMTITIPNASTPFFTRHDKFMRYIGNQQNYIVQSNGVWSATPPLAYNNQCNSSGSIEFNKNALLSQETTGPLNREHFTCDPNFNYIGFDYVMTPGMGVGSGYMQRFPHEQERNWFCDIGYPLTNIGGINQFGDNIYVQHDYANSCNVLCNVVAVSDVYNSLPTIVTPLVNDLNVSANTIISEVRVHTSNAGTITNLTSTDFSFVPNCNFSGWVTLSYVPKCVIGNTLEASGTAYIFIFIEPVNDILSISKIVEPPQSGSTFSPGDIIHYTIIVENSSDEPQYGLSIEDILSTNFNLSSFSSSDFSINGNLIQTPIFSIAGQQTLVFNYDLALNEQLWVGCGLSIENCATLSRNGNCSISTCNTIEVNKAFVDISNGTLWSSISPPLSAGAALRIHGNVHIDAGNPIFDGYEMQFLTDDVTQTLGQITIESSQSLAIKQSYLYGCENMWKGIVLKDGLSSNNPTKLNIESSNAPTNSLILDAYTAIDAQDNTEVLVYNTRFQQNGIAINTHPSLQNAAALRVENSIFDCQQILLSEVFPGKQWSIAGIVVENMYFQTGVLQNAMNVFKNMPFGIMGFNARLNIQKCRFENINTDNVWYYGNTPNHIDGTGIVSTGTWLSGNGNSMLIQKGGGENGLPSFVNCKRGVYASGPLLETVIVTDNRMENVARGIELQNVSYATISIQKNYLSCRDYGILYRSGVKSKVTVSKNYIYLDNPNINSNPSLRVGIYFNNVNTPITLDMNRNQVDINRRANAAIWIEGCTGASQIPYADGATLENNGIRMLNGSNNTYTANRRGICAINSPYIKIINHQNLDNLPCPNTFPPGTPAITGSGWNTFPTNVNAGQTAMHIENCRNSLIQCNTMDNTRVGMRFYNDCDNSEVGGNDFNQHSYGLYIGGASSRIGQQEGRGNNWNWQGSAATGYIWGAWNASLFFSLSEIEVNEPSSFPNPPTAAAYPKVPTKNGGLSHFPTYNNGWFKNTSLSNFSCGGNIPAVERFSPNDYWVANDSLVSDIYPEETQWSAQKALFEALAQDTTIIPDTGAIRLFFDEKSQTNLADFQSIHQAQTRLYEWNTANAIQNNAIQIQNWIQMRFENDSLIASGDLDSLDIATLEMTNEGLRQQIQSLSNTNRLLTEAMLAQQTTDADTVLANNATITVNEVYEQNEKTVNEIYLAAFAKPQNIAFISPLEAPTIPFISLDSAQTAQLEAIAWQCPYSGGEAVYIARSMLAVVYDAVEYDNDSLCAVVGISWRQGNHQENTEVLQQSVQVYPNPTSGDIHFILTTPIAQNSKIIIRNVFGQLVHENILPENTTEYIFDTRHLSEGVFFYEIQTEEQSFTGKFVTVK